MKKYFLLVLILFTACTTNNRGYKTTDQVEQQLVTMSAQEVYHAWGKPTVISKTAVGQQKWHYYEQPGDLSAGICLVDLYVEGNSIIFAQVQSQGKTRLLFPLQPCQNFLNKLPSILPVEE